MSVGPCLAFNYFSRRLADREAETCRSITFEKIGNVYRESGVGQARIPTRRPGGFAKKTSPTRVDSYGSSCDVGMSGETTLRLKPSAGWTGDSNLADLPAPNMSHR